MITHISFDLDGTLITGDFDTIFWNEELPQRLADQHRVPLALAQEHAYAEYYKALYIERVENWTSVDYWCERLHIRPPATLEHLHRHIRLYDDTIPALEQATKQYPLILFTANDDVLLRQKLNATGIAKYFTHSLNAPTRTGRKNSHGYTNLLTGLNLQPDALLHIGDHQADDYDAPRTAGIKAVLIDRTCRGSGNIRSLDDLPAIIEADRLMPSKAEEKAESQNIVVQKCSEALRLR